jgi:hypothetical protein
VAQPKLVDSLAFFPKAAKRRPVVPEKRSVKRRPNPYSTNHRHKFPFFVGKKYFNVGYPLYLSVIFYYSALQYFVISGDFRNIRDIW